MTSDHSRVSSQSEYRELPGGHFPALLISIAHENNLELGFDTDAYLDSGAEGSIFNGALLSSLEIALINNKPKSYEATTGAAVTAYLHRVRLTLPEIGNFNMEIGFSDGPIKRNLLGRDFFNLVQIGFREHWQTYYLTPVP